MFGNWALMPEVGADGSVDKAGRHVILNPNEPSADGDVEALTPDDPEPRGPGKARKQTR